MMAGQPANGNLSALASPFKLTTMKQEVPKVNLGALDDNAPPTTQMKILEPEMIALQRCLKAC